MFYKVEHEDKKFKCRELHYYSGKKSSYFCLCTLNVLGIQIRVICSYLNTSLILNSSVFTVIVGISEQKKTINLYD